MRFFIKIIFICILFLLPVFCFAENSSSSQKEETFVQTIERDEYNVQIKQYGKNYPIILYIVFKESTPLLDDIKKILRTELLTLTKTRKIENNIIASAWFDNQISDDLEKIELAKKYGAFVRVYDKEKKREIGIMAFNEYIQYLKKKKEEKKNKAKETLNQ